MDKPLIVYLNLTSNDPEYRELGPLEGDVAALVVPSGMMAPEALAALWPGDDPTLDNYYDREAVEMACHQWPGAVLVLVKAALEARKDAP